ncbi:MAG: MBL fold metallo-hydrolase [Syntrophaceae bacterium]
MVIQEPGKVTERITLLGLRESCVYLLDGRDEFALLGGGMVTAIPAVLEQITGLGLDTRKIRRIVIMHAHFDHVGIVPYFRRRWPWLKVTASGRAKDNLSRPAVIKAIVDFSTLLLAQAGLGERAREFGLERLDAIVVDEAVQDGDLLTCGDRTLQIISTPGHSSCSMAVYVREEQALLASDAGGIPFGESIFAAANSNFDQYQASLEKMSRYPVEAHLSEHYGAFTGENARQFLPRSMEAARTTRSLIEESLKRTGDIDATVSEIEEVLTREAKGYFLPREVIHMVLGQMAGFLAKSR